MLLHITLQIYYKLLQNYEYIYTYIIPNTYTVVGMHQKRYTIISGIRLII